MPLRLDEKAARVEYVRWFVHSSGVLERYVPTAIDEFNLAEGDEAHFGRQALLIQHINAKLDVLRRAWREM